MATHRILVAVDGSDGARRALAYVAEIVGNRPDTALHLLHLLPPIPPSQLEHAGAEKPEGERALDDALRDRQERWLAEREGEAQRLLDDAERLLADHGASVRIERECRSSVGSAAVARDCLDAAHASWCDTVVLARNSMPWHRELLHPHPSDALVRRGRGLAVWVIE
jgi:nucleotide-binding universal stress UspA family protein